MSEAIFNYIIAFNLLRLPYEKVRYPMLLRLGGNELGNIHWLGCAEFIYIATDRLSD